MYGNDFSNNVVDFENYSHFLILLSNVSNIPRTVQFTLIHTFPNRVRYISNHWNKTGECCITKLRKNGSSQVLALLYKLANCCEKKMQQFWSFRHNVPRKSRHSPDVIVVNETNRGQRALWLFCVKRGIMGTSTTQTRVIGVFCICCHFCLSVLFF